MDDLIKRSDAIKAIKQWLDNDGSLFDVGLNQAIREIKRLPSAEEEEFEWCHDCKEYDQDAHCCHRYSKRIRQAVEEIKANRPHLDKDVVEPIGNGNVIMSEDTYEELLTDRPQEKTISVDVLREILSDVKETHRNNSEAEAVMSDVWDEVVDMLKGADNVER